LKGKNYGFRRTSRKLSRASTSFSDIYISVPGRLGPSIAYASPRARSRRPDRRCRCLLCSRLCTLEPRSRRHGAAGEGNFAVLFDRRGIRIADSYKEKELFRPAGALPVEEIARMVEERRFGDATRELLEKPVTNAGGVRPGREATRRTASLSACRPISQPSAWA